MYIQKSGGPDPSGRAWRLLPRYHVCTWIGADISRAHQAKIQVIDLQEQSEWQIRPGLLQRLESGWGIDNIP